MFAICNAEVLLHCAQDTKTSKKIRTTCLRKFSMFWEIVIFVYLVLGLGLEYVGVAGHVLLREQHIRNGYLA